MSLSFSLTDLSDFNETVTLYRPETGWTQQVRHATRINPGRSETGFPIATGIPQIRIVWFLPTTIATDLKRGDRIIDKDNREWILFDAIPYSRFNSIRCRCIHESLSPGANDYINLYRTESLTGQTEPGKTNLTLLASYVPAIIKSRHWKSERPTALPFKNVQDEIEFWVKSTLDLTVTDLVRSHQNGELYEIVAQTKPSLYSDWGTLTVRRLTGDHSHLRFPDEL